MLVTTEPAAFYSEIAITSDDNGMVWLTWMNPDTNIYYSYWNGSNWSNPAPIDTHPAKDRCPKMTFDGERIWVTWIRRVDLLDTLSVYASYTYGVGVEEKPVANLPPSVLGLSQNYPNPFSSEVMIEYALSDAGDVMVEVYNSLGQKVRQLQSGIQPKGTHRLSWDGKDDSGRLLPSGIYFYRIDTQHSCVIQKLMLLR